MFTIDAGSFRSPNYDTKNGKPVLHTPAGILLHTGEGTRASDINTLCDPHTGDPRLNTPQDPRVSSNYYVTRDGTIFQLVPDTYRAWHAGPSNYAGLLDWNLALGVETEHKAGQDWPKVQVDALAWLFQQKIAQYHIIQNRIAAHRWVATPAGRKKDPSNWGDDALHMWIAQLYVTPTPPTDYWKLWGTAVELRDDMKEWSICQMWYQNAPWLGAVRDLRYASDGSGDCTLWCSGGAIVYFARTKRSWLQRP